MTKKKWPVTIDEAARVVIAALSDDDMAKIVAMRESELIGLHFSLGMWIRNNLGVWQGNDALMQAVRDRGPNIQSDDVSMMIIEAVWKRLREMTPKVH